MTDWTQTLTIIFSVLGANMSLIIYMLVRQDKITESIEESKKRIAMIEGYLWKRLNEEK